MKVFFHCALAAFLAGFATAAAGGGVVVLSTVLSDNGDGDGFADTSETVGLQLKVRNMTGNPLTGCASAWPATRG